MKKFIVLAVYRCEYDGEDTKDRDFQAILVHAQDWKMAVKKVSGKRACKYKSTENKWIKWALVNIMAVERIDGNKDLEEVTGFIADKSELYGKSSLIRPSLREMIKPQRAARR